eukprot:10340082-Alexandrium_andersonii.AAC.1
MPDLLGGQALAVAHVLVLEALHPDAHQGGGGVRTTVMRATEVKHGLVWQCEAVVRAPCVDLQAVVRPDRAETTQASLDHLFHAEGLCCTWLVIDNVHPLASVPDR